jgi:hypothetical protein
VIFFILLQESRVKGDKHKHDTNINQKSIPEVISEEHHVNRDDNHHHNAEQKQGCFCHDIIICQKRLLWVC